jgi:hypothetical protein
LLLENREGCFWWLSVATGLPLQTREWFNQKLLSTLVWAKPLEEEMEKGVRPPEDKRRILGTGVEL